MRFHYGAPPTNPTFNPEQEGWTSLVEPSMGVQNTIGLVFVVLAFAIGPWLVYPFTQGMPEANPLGLLDVAVNFASAHPYQFMTMILLLIPAHELLHAMVYPKALSKNTVIGLWVSHFLFYANSDAAMPSTRMALAAVTPLLVLSVGPVLFSLATGTPLVLASILAVFNLTLVGVDLLLCYLMLARVPRGALVRNQGAKTWWKAISPLSAQDQPVNDEDLEWAVRLALEGRRRVKEQQKRIGAAEFRNTHFSYTLGTEGVETFVSTPELQSQAGIGDDPLEPGQVWAISPGGEDEHPGLFRIEATEGPGSGVHVLNRPVPPAFQESIRFAEQNLYARAMQMVGDRDPRAHEFSVQLRGFDSAKSGAKTGVPALIALCSALVHKSVRGGLVLVGELSLGGSIEPVHNPVTLAELAAEKGAQALLMPVSCRRQLVDISDEIATRLDIEFYQDARDALLKALVD